MTEGRLTAGELYDIALRGLEGSQEPNVGPPDREMMIRRAQVYATLAVAAALGGTDDSKKRTGGVW